MKRCYLGVGVLLLALILGIISSRWMQRSYVQLHQQLLSAAQAAQNGEWEQLEALVDWAEGDWDRRRSTTAVLAEHPYLDRAEEAFSQLAPAAKDRNREECTRLCLELAHIFLLLSEDQQLKWENLL